MRGPAGAAGRGGQLSSREPQCPCGYSLMYVASNPAAASSILNPARPECLVRRSCGSATSLAAERTNLSTSPRVSAIPSSRWKKGAPPRWSTRSCLTRGLLGGGSPDRSYRGHGGIIAWELTVGAATVVHARASLAVRRGPALRAPARPASARPGPPRLGSTRRISSHPPAGTAVFFSALSQFAMVPRPASPRRCCCSPRLPPPSRATRRRAIYLAALPPSESRGGPSRRAPCRWHASCRPPRRSQPIAAISTPCRIHPRT